VGVIVTAGLWLFGVKYPLVLGLLAAVFELVPLVGPILSGAVAFFVAIGDSFVLGIYIVAFFILVQQLENNVLIPLIFKKSMKIHPVMILVVLLAGGYAAGFIGVILSVPIALLAQEMITYFSERKKAEELEVEKVSGT
jgi:predicted PurR-regulated permease PerM